MSGPEVTVGVEARPDFAEVDALHGFGTPEMWAHEYEADRRGAPVFVVARDGDGRLVGTQAFIHYDLVQGGKVAPSGRSERSLVAPALRGKRLFERMVTAGVAAGAARGMALAWGSTAARRAFENAGFTFVSGHRLYLVGATGLFAALRLAPRLVAGISVKQLRARSRDDGVALLSLLLLLPSALLGLLLAPWRWLMAAASGLTVSEAAFDAGVNALSAELLDAAGDVRLQHDAALWDWSLTQGELSIRLFAHDAGGRLRGYVVAQLDAPGPGLLTVADFLFADAASARVLMSALRARAAAHGQGMLVMALNRRHRLQAGYVAPLVTCGLLPAYAGGAFVMRAMAPGATPPGIAAWYLTDLWFLLWRKRP